MPVLDLGIPLNENMKKVILAMSLYTGLFFDWNSYFDGIWYETRQTTKIINYYEIYMSLRNSRSYEVMRSYDYTVTTKWSIE